MVLDARETTDRLVTIPPHYPRHGCPPDDAGDAAGARVYVLIEGQMPTPSDFRSRRERNPGRSPYEDSDKECRACGLSVTTDIRDHETLRRLFKGHRRKRSAFGVLGEGCGRLKPTESDAPLIAHHTWWIDGNASPARWFEPVP